MSTQVEKTFEPSNDDIEMMQRQIDITAENAKYLLIKFNGDFFNAVSSAMGDDVEEGNKESETINISENHLDPAKRIQQFRNILDQKDKLFTEHTKKDYETNMDTLHDIGYIAFTPTSKEYIKENKKMTLKSFIEFVAKPFIETGNVDDIKPITFEQIQEDPNLLGPKPIKEEDLDNIDKQQKALTEGTDNLLKSDNDNIHIDVVESDNNKDENKTNDIIGTNSKSNIKQEFEKIPVEKIELSKTSSNKKASNKSSLIKKQLSKYFEEKLEIKLLNGKAEKMIRKWLCNDAGIIYKESLIKNADMLGVLESKLEAVSMNVLATKLMAGANILKSGQYYTGNVVVVDKWFKYNEGFDINEI